MTGIELVYFLLALVGVVGFLAVVRRAASKQVGDGGRKRELREPDASSRRERVEPSTETSGATERDADRDEDDSTGASRPGGATDLDEAEHLRERLHKTRGGFVARLGKLFGK